MDNLVRDLRHAARALARAPGFTAAAAVALALGVGGSTAIFSVLDAVVLRPLAVPHADRLVRLYVTTPIRQSDSFSPLDYLDLAKENGAFEAVAATSEAGLSITTAAGPMRLEGARVTASFFATLRVQPAIGRALSPDEDLRGPPPVAILTDKLWRREFWEKHAGRFPEGVVHEDIPVVLPAHLAARSVDVLAPTVYHWRLREGGSESITQRRLEPKALSRV